MATATNPPYAPSRAPSTLQASKSPDTGELLKWIDRELRAIAAAMTDVTALELRPINTAPLRPREGMIVFADGTNWNPGFGKGLYVYRASAWAFLDFLR